MQIPIFWWWGEGSEGGVGGNTGANCGSWSLLTAPSGGRCDNHHHYPCLYQHRISALKLDVLLLWLHCTFGPFSAVSGAVTGDCFLLVRIVLKYFLC